MGRSCGSVAHVALLDNQARVGVTTSAWPAWQPAYTVEKPLKDLPIALDIAGLCSMLVIADGCADLPQVS